MMKYMYILGTIFFTVYGQLILKWRIAIFGEIPSLFIDKIMFFTKAVFDPFILSGFISAFIASLFWMAAMTKFELSFAYPFMSLSFVLVFCISILIFGEQVNIYKISGLLLIIIGVFITSRGI